MCNIISTFNKCLIDFQGRKLSIVVAYRYYNIVLRQTLEHSVTES